MKLSRQRKLRAWPSSSKRHPLCTTPEVSHYLGELVAKGTIRQVYSSIHAIIPKTEAVGVINSGVGAEALLHERRSMFSPIGLHGRMFRLQKPRRFCRSVRPWPIKAVA